jgi:hypothetical protein
MHSSNTQWTGPLDLPAPPFTLQIQQVAFAFIELDQRFLLCIPQSV